MRFLFLSQVFPDDTAPVRGTFNRALCQALAEQHDVHVIAPRTWVEAIPRRLKGQGKYSADSVLTGTQVTADYPAYWYLPKVLQHRYGRAMFRSIQRRLRNHAKEHRPDIVLSYWAHPEGAAGLEAAHSLGIPSVCIVGGSDVLLLPHRNRLRYREVARVLRESDAIVTISNGLRDACLALGAPPERVHTIYQGIDRALFQSRDQARSRRKLRIPLNIPTFLWVGRMVEVKQLRLLIEAFARVNLTGRHVKLYLLGDGPLLEPLRTLARQLGAETAIDFVGPVPQDQLADWYSAVNATVLCSRSEGLPNVLRESLACGTPFVSTDVGSIREISDASNSILISTGDSTALAHAMQQILDPKYREGALNHRPRSWREMACELADLCAGLKVRTGIEGSSNASLPSRPIAPTDNHSTGSSGPAPLKTRSLRSEDQPREHEVAADIVDFRRTPDSPSQSTDDIEGRQQQGISRSEAALAANSQQESPQETTVEEDPFDFMVALNRRLQETGASAEGWEVRR